PARLNLDSGRGAIIPQLLHTAFDQSPAFQIVGPRACYGDVQPCLVHFSAPAVRLDGNNCSGMGGRRLAPGDILAGIRDRACRRLAPCVDESRRAHKLILRFVLWTRCTQYGSSLSAYERAGASLG